MKTRKYVRSGYSIVLIAVFTLLTVPAKADYDIEAGLNEALNRVITLPMPQALDPIITVSQELDLIALSTANGMIVRKIEEIQHEEMDADSRREKIIARKRMRAARRLQSIFSQLKRQKEIKERKAKEDGWDPFYALLKADTTLDFRNVNHFSLFTNGEEYTEAFSSIIRPVFGGDVSEMVKVSDASLSVMLTPSQDTNFMLIDLNNLDIRLNSFDISDGLPSGPNKIEKHNEITPGQGQLRISNGGFNYRFEGKITNDLYSNDIPILVFVSAIGVLDTGSGELSISADDPMLVPLPDSLKEIGYPAWSAATSAVFNSTTKTIEFRNAIIPGADPHISMLRYNDGSYSTSKSKDVAVGATLEIAPLRYDKEIAKGEYAFLPTELSIINGNDILLKGTINNIMFNGNTGEFFGALKVETVNPGTSAFVTELLKSKKEISIQFATGVGTFDLLEMTDTFRISKEIPLIDLMHGTAEFNDNKRKQNTLLIGITIAVLALLVIYRAIRKRP